MEINSTRNAHLLTASSTEAFPTKLRVAAIFRNPTFNNIFFDGGGLYVSSLKFPVIVW